MVTQYLNGNGGSCKLIIDLAKFIAGRAAFGTNFESILNKKIEDDPHQIAAARPDRASLPLRGAPTSGLGPS